MVILRDGRHLVGELISYDHFGEAHGGAQEMWKGRDAALLQHAPMVMVLSGGCFPTPLHCWLPLFCLLLPSPPAPLAGSMVLRNARERHFARGKKYDLPMGGIYLVRGENVNLMGVIVSADR